MTRPCPQFYTLSPPKYTGVGFTKWTSSGLCPSASMPLRCAAYGCDVLDTHRARYGPRAWELLMEDGRRPAAQQVQVAERVTFRDGHRTVAGHVARKGRTYAHVVTDDGSVANYRKQESLDSQVIDFPVHDFRILPRKGNFATEPLIDLGAQHEPIMVYGDSQLVIQQIFGKWKIKAGFYVPYAHKAKELCRAFSNLHGQWIPRRQNTVADELSKRPLRAAGNVFRLQPDAPSLRHRSLV